MNVLETLVEVKLANSEDFLKIKETLSRIGIAPKTGKKLYQSCLILHKQGKYYICHFKEMFALDRKETNFTEEDRARRNTIVSLLAEWGLLTVVDPSKLEPKAAMSQVKIIPYKEKHEWELISKYSIGKKKV